MANEQNLRPCEYKLTQEQAKKGGQNSGKARREKRAVQRILSDFLSMQAADVPQLQKVAEKLGVQTTGSVKELFTIVCALNTIRSGSLSDLEKLTALLGEQIESGEAEAKKQAAFLYAVKKAVSDED